MSNLNKIISLLKKTGDKAIILDQNSEPSYVIMTISDYEQLILGKSGVSGLTEAELLAKINRDMAIWKDSQEISDLPLDQYDFAQDLGEFSDFSPAFTDQEKEPDVEEIESDHYYFESVE